MGKQVTVLKQRALPLWSIKISTNSDFFTIFHYASLGTRPAIKTGKSLHPTIIAQCISVKITHPVDAFNLEQLHHQWKLCASKTQDAEVKKSLLQMRHSKYTQLLLLLVSEFVISTSRQFPRLAYLSPYHRLAVYKNIVMSPWHSLHRVTGSGCMHKF